MSLTNATTSSFKEKMTHLFEEYNAVYKRRLQIPCLNELSIMKVYGYQFMQTGET